MKVIEREKKEERVRVASLLSIFLEFSFFIQIMGGGRFTLNLLMIIAMSNTYKILYLFPFLFLQR